MLLLDVRNQVDYDIVATCGFQNLIFMIKFLLLLVKAYLQPSMFYLPTVLRIRQQILTP